MTNILTVSRLLLHFDGRLALTGMSRLGINQRTARLSLLSAISVVVCSAQFIPSDAGVYAAKAVTLTGQVSVRRDFRQIALSAGETVAVMEEIVTGADGHAVFQVSDGS